MTNQVSGRLGNQLLSLIKALYVAEQYHWPFYCRASALTIHLKSRLKTIKDLPPLKGQKWFVTDKLPSVYSPNDEFIIARSYSLKSYELDDASKNRIRKIIEPPDIIEPMILPKDRGSVAIHIRTGSKEKETTRSKQFYTAADLSKHDPKNIRDVMQSLKKSDTTAHKRQFLDLKYFLMSLPLQYYVDQIRFLYNYLDQKPLYVHVFTDHHNPQTLIKQLKHHLSSLDINFGNNKSSFKDHKDIWNDLIHMTEFDYLIRSNSTFSTSAEYLGQHKIVISPEAGSWYGDMLAVNTIRLLEGKKVTYYKNY